MVPVKLIATAALMAAQVALSASRKIEGPRLDSTKVTLAEYGTPLDDFWGIRRLPGRPMFWADDLDERKKKSKTKGGKYTEYTYTGDWAVAIAGHQIDAVRRIWFDEHLVYQVGDVGPISVGGFASNLLTQASGRVLKLGVGRNMRIYLGTDTQNPDPLIEAWMEDHPDFGANCTSAYRGTAYIVFQDIPLEKFGNRIPQVTVEAIRVKNDSYPYEVFSTSGTLATSQFSPDFSTLLVSLSGAYEPWDVPTRTMLANSVSSPLGHYAITDSGTAYGLTSFFGQEVSKHTIGGGSTIVASSTPTILGGVWYAGGQVYFLSAGSGTDAYRLAGDTVVTIPVGFDPSSYFTGLDGSAWAVGPNGTDISFFNIDTDSGFSVPGGSGVVYAFVNSDGNFVAWQNGTAYLVDPVAQSVLSTASIGGGQMTEAAFRTFAPGSTTFWLHFSEWDATDLSLVRTESLSNWVGGGFTTQGVIYDPINHALIAKPLLSGQLYWLYLDRVNSNGVTLETIVEDEGNGVGCTIDASALDQTVPGYSVGPGPAKDRIAPLLDLHDSILRSHDFGIQGIKRGTSSVATIEVGKFVKDQARYEVEIAQDNDLPQRLEVKYAAINNDQEANNVIAFRHTSAVDTSRVQQIDLSTYADTPDAMQQKADRFLRRIWNSRSVVKNALTAQYLAAEPGDLYDLDLDGVTWTCELEKVTLSATNPSLKCEWRRTFPSLNSLGQGTAPDMDGRPDETILIPSQTKGFVLDIPFVEDADNDINPQLYIAAGKYTSFWPGAAVWDGSDGSYDDNVAALDSSQGSTWGIVTGAMGDANPNLWDRGNSIEITVYGGTLSSSTEAAIDADNTINQCVIGYNGRWEICNFTTATLTGSTTVSRTYDVSGFLRGRRGTEENTGNHAAGDAFLLLTQAQMMQLGVDLVGDDLSYKVQSLGRDQDIAPAIDLQPYTGAVLKPYAPARLKWTTDGTDLFGEIFRRTRIGGAWTGGSAIPLSENSEEYEVDILDGSGNVLRTIAVSGTNTFTYAAAQIAADSGSVATPPSANVYQLSDAVGRGFALAA